MKYFIQYVYPFWFLFLLCHMCTVKWMIFVPLKVNVWFGTHNFLNWILIKVMDSYQSLNVNIKSEIRKKNKQQNPHASTICTFLICPKSTLWTIHFNLPHRINKNKKQKTKNESDLFNRRIIHNICCYLINWLIEWK